jgi:D-amino-acid dehydrogenase
MSPRAAEAGLAAHARTDWGTATYSEMSTAELARYEGVLARPPAAAVMFSGTGQVNEPQAARDALLASFTDRCGEIVADGAALVAARGAGAQVRLASGGTRQADAVLIAAGAWSAPLMAQLGVRAPLIGERGYSVQSAEHVWPADLPTTVFEENFIIFSRFTSGLRATSFLEFGAPDAPADARKWAQLERRIAELGVKFSATPDRWMGPRPTLPDYVPAIGRLERAPNVLYAFGHHHLGLTMCAITAELATALAMDAPATIDLRPFRAERFG